MENLIDKQEFIYCCRRKILLSGSIFVGTCFIAPVSLASGGGDGGDGGEQSDQSNTSTQSRKSKKTPTKEYSQATFLRMRKSQLKSLQHQSDNNEIYIKIDGFSNYMSAILVNMAVRDRTNTRKLVRDMSDIEKNIKDRRSRGRALHTRLKKEIDRIVIEERKQEKIVRKLSKDTGGRFERLLRKKNPSAADRSLMEEEHRLAEIRRQRGDVAQWKFRLLY